MAEDLTSGSAGNDGVADAGGQPDLESAPSGGGGEFQVPSGQRLVSDDEFATYQRYGEQVKGFKAWGEKLSQAGLKDPADLDQMVSMRDTLASRGIDANAFTAAFAEPEPQGGAPEGFDPEALLDQAADRAYERLQLSQAEAAHDAARKAEPEQILKVLSADERVSSVPKALLSRVAQSVALEATDLRAFYDDGPLRGKALRPLDEAGVAKAVERVVAELAAEQGAELASIGREAGKSSASSASDAGGNGQPGASTHNTSGGAPSREDSVRFLQAQRAKRGGTTSSRAQ